MFNCAAGLICNSEEIKNMDTEIKVPQVLKAKVMLWTDVDYHAMETINKMQSIPELESVLCSVLEVDLPEPKRGVLLELYVQTVLFCRDRSFKMEQTSALLSIVKSIHEANVESPLNNREDCIKYCKELLLCHSVRRPPFSINLFGYEEVNSILLYIYDSYVRHYKLYKYIFTPQVKLDLTLTYSGIPDHDDHTVDSSAPDAENVMEAGAETHSLQTQEASITESEGTPRGSKSDLKTMIEKEVREQMALVSGQMDQQMKQNVDQQIRTLESSQVKHKAKKK